MKQKSGFLVKILVVCVAVYAVFNLLELRSEILEKQQEIAAYEAQIEIYRGRNAQKQAELAVDQSEDSVKSEAREELGFVEPGERVFYDITN